MKEELNLEDFRKIINGINKTIQENKIFLSELDSFIGDGDHGITLAKGFTKVMEDLKISDPSNISDLLQATGKSLIATIGGVTGPIFGTLFTEMGKALDTGKQSVDISDLYNMFSKSLNKIMAIGGAKPGDKTMVDALYPAVESLKDSSEKKVPLKQSFEDISTAAKKGAESTKEMVALKGRARYLGERSIGYEDAGANTIYFIFEVFRKSF
ncbi:MAG: dihydroxyacetone kinase subunit DhaL [Candidatus Humimicrobiaceae bacterium]